MGERKIVWTKKAEQKLDLIGDYLLEVWTKREVDAFKENLLRKLEIIEQIPEIGKKSELDSSIRKFPLDKHNFIVYRIRSTRITILNIYAYKQNPGLNPWF